MPGKYLALLLLLMISRQGISQSTSASFKDCDNVVHDKLTGAQNRSPTDCEVKYDLYVKNAFIEAFDKVVKFFPENNWQINKVTDLTPLTGIPRMKLNDSWPSYYLDIGMNHDAPAYKKYVEEQSAQMNKTDVQMQEILKLGYEIHGATAIIIYGHINRNQRQETVTFKGKHKILQVKGTDYVVQYPYAQALSGGGVESALVVTDVFLGSWKMAYKVQSDASENLIAQPAYNKNGERLNIQNISLRIECNPELAEQVLKQIDFGKLKAILNM